MDRALMTVINWTKLIIISAILCSVFSLIALAQAGTDKPMEAKSRTALIEELKGVVSKMETDQKKSSMVAKKWDARKDLNGKTKREVINLLYADVKSVITDLGTQYQIYSTFAFYQQIPDESPAAQGQTPATALSKDEAVKSLIDLTFSAHPYVGIEESLAQLPGTKEVKEGVAAERKNRIEGFEAALKLNRKLTPEQKTFVRTNYDQLIKMTDKITEEAINTNFPTEQWIKEGLQQSYTNKFTNPELNSLITYFQGSAGRQVLKYIRISRMADLITGNGGKLDYTAADKAEHDKFAATPLGKKFITAYLNEAVAYEQRKEGAVRSTKPDADGFAIYEPENLNRLFNKFVADNYKK